jgi:hypothetical protein
MAKKPERSMLPIVYYWSEIEGYLLNQLVQNVNHVKIQICTRNHRFVIAELMQCCDLAQTVFFFHIDQTCDGAILKAENRRSLIEGLINCGSIVMNGQVIDISKRIIQRHNRQIGLPNVIADNVGFGDEQLIVKTDLNFGGQPEVAFRGQSRTPLISGPWGYVIQCRREIPAHWWSLEELHIERFITNSDGLFYRLNIMGTKISVIEAWSGNAITRINASCEQQVTHTDIDELAALAGTTSERWFMAAQAGVAFARTFGLQYGAIDLVKDDSDIFYVIDVNKTPYWGANMENDATVYLRSWLLE